MREQDLPVLETYAEALMAAARGAGALDDVFDEANGLRTILADHRGLERLMEKPAIEKEDKKAVVRRVFAGRLSALMLHLPLLLIDKGRGGLWDGILDTFVTMVERQRGVYRARVSTAHVLPDDERQRMRGTLERFTGKQLRIAFLHLPDLLGGVLFRCGDTMIDTTLRGALNELGRRLQGVKAH